MSFEFECNKCGHFTIFKEISEIPRSERLCLNCKNDLVISRDLVRFDRSRRDQLALCLPPEQTVHHRVKLLNEKVADLNDRIGRLEQLILDAEYEDVENDTTQ